MMHLQEKEGKTRNNMSNISTIKANESNLFGQKQNQIYPYRGF